eukprot:s968_g8.t3
MGGSHRHTSELPQTETGVVRCFHILQSCKYLISQRCSRCGRSGTPARQCSRRCVNSAEPVPNLILTSPPERKAHRSPLRCRRRSCFQQPSLGRVLSRRYGRHTLQKSHPEAVAEEAAGEEGVPNPILKLQERQDEEFMEIFVGGLPSSSCEAQVRREFAECGEITRFSMPQNEEGRHQGIATIVFKTGEGVRLALKKNGMQHLGRPLKVAFRDPAGPLQKVPWVQDSCARWADVMDSEGSEEVSLEFPCLLTMIAGAGSMKRSKCGGQARNQEDKGLPIETELVGRGKRKEKKHRSKGVDRLVPVGSSLLLQCRRGLVDVLEWTDWSRSDHGSYSSADVVIASGTGGRARTLTRSGQTDPGDLLRVRQDHGCFQAQTLLTPVACYMLHEKLRLMLHVMPMKCAGMVSLLLLDRFPKPEARCRREMPSGVEAKAMPIQTFDPGRQRSSSEMLRRCCQGAPGPSARSRCFLLATC